MGAPLAPRDPHGLPPIGQEHRRTDALRLERSGPRTFSASLKRSCTLPTSATTAFRMWAPAARASSASLAPR